MAYRGVNLAGAEFAVDSSGNGPLPGDFGVHYIYPDAKYVPGYDSPGYFSQKGMNTYRLPFRWERLQPVRNAAFNAAELERLKTTVAGLTATGATVVLDPHNYARYGTALIGSASVPNADFADFWKRLATQFAGDSQVLFGLMNEPHDMPTEQWVAAANAGIAAIRGAGATNLILVPGNGWTGAASWSDNWYGTPNATAMLDIVDPQDHFAVEVHQYFDADGSGTNPSCVSATIGVERMQGFTGWLRTNGLQGFLGEFGAGSGATCLSALENTLTHLQDNADVYLGWTYWAAGPWWGDYWMGLEPNGQTDVPQMNALEPFLSSTPPQADPPPQGDPPPPIVPSTGPVRIMPLGDSITLGVNGGYRNGLFSRLATAGKTVDFVGSQSDPYTKAADHDHEGHPGFTIGNISSAADAWLGSHTPTHVLMMIGTNDVAWWSASTANQIADENAALIDQVLGKLPGVWVIVGSIPPITSSIIAPNNVDRAQLAQAYNAAIAQRVQTRIAAGKKVRFANVNSVLQLSDLYDGVHPTEAAADKMAQVWFDALLPTLP